MYHRIGVTPADSEDHMPETDASYNPSGEAPQGSAPVERAPFPWQRFFLSLLFAVCGWFAFWITILLAIALWVLIAVSREPHPEFKSVVTVSARYLSHCLAYVVLLREDKPFPLGPLPSASEGPI
jgi:hypothetical protein